MKCAILAGGRGTRLADETLVQPKPMVQVGGRPILWHIMKHYGAYGIREFVVALGYKGEAIKKYLLDAYCLDADIKVSVDSGTVTCLGTPEREPWAVELIDTGLETMTGGRIRRLAPYLGNETFMMTWGDGVSDVDLHALLRFHRAHGRLATLTAVRPPARFGHLDLDGDEVVEFSEKPQAREGWINGAFFVVEPEVQEYIDGDDTVWEHAPLQRLARDGQLMAFRHEGFWQCMDTLRDKLLLEKLWAEGTPPPWKIW
jgi:glucose-1-phosphate cytidylyltransferase